jgi:hypothetical protein
MEFWASILEQTRTLEGQKRVDDYIRMFQESVSLMQIILQLIFLHPIHLI